MTERTQGGRTLGEHLQRRRALDYAFEIVDRNGVYLTPAQQDILRRELAAAYVVGEVRSMAQRHLNPNSLLRFSKEIPRRGNIFRK